MQLLSQKEGFNMNIKSVQRTKDNTFDLISISGKVLTINGKNYDLDNLAVRPEQVMDESGKVTNQDEIDSFSDRVWKGQDGKPEFIIYVGKYHNYAWVNNKMQKLFGFDDGIVTLEELTKYLQWHNELQSILDEYTEPLQKKKAAADAVYGDKKTWREAANSMNAVYAEREEKIRALNKRWIESAK